MDKGDSISRVEQSEHAAETILALRHLEQPIHKVADPTTHDAIINVDPLVGDKPDGADGYLAVCFVAPKHLLGRNRGVLNFHAMRSPAGVLTETSIRAPSMENSCA